MQGKISQHITAHLVSCYFTSAERADRQGRTLHHATEENTTELDNASHLPLNGGCRDTEHCRTKHNNAIQQNAKQNTVSLHLLSSRKSKQRRKKMTQKKTNTTTTESTISLEAIRTTKLKVQLVGTSDLILNKKARSFEREEIFKQSHPKGTKIPADIQQPYNMWEKLITSINWRDPIVYHDDDYSLYNEEEWKNYMENNAPCILGKAFQESFKETFISCGFKDSTGKSGADLKRTVSVSVKNPITFAQAGYDQHLAMTNGLNKVNVLTQQNQFMGWTCDIEITFLEGTFPRETILALVQMSGNFIGVGSRRGEGYGRYTVGKIEVK